MFHHSIRSTAFANFQIFIQFGVRLFSFFYFFFSGFKSMARNCTENNVHINENIINQKQRDGTDRINFNHLKTQQCFLLLLLLVFFIRAYWPRSSVSNRRDAVFEIFEPLVHPTDTHSYTRVLFWGFFTHELNMCAHRTTNEFRMYQRM